MSLSSPFALEYSELEKAAQALGFHQDAAMIRQRRNDLEQPFLLFVMGAPGSGKSTLINTLAGRAIAPVDTPQPWLNIYRSNIGGQEFAEVFRRNAPDRPITMSAEEARDLELTGPLYKADPSLAIDRIVWYVQAPELPDQVALVEAPLDAADASCDGYSWQADAMLLILDAERLRDESGRRFPAIRQQGRLPAPSLGIVTHLQTVSRDYWTDLLRLIRASTASHLDHVIPFALHHSPQGLLTEDTSGLVRREVRNRFYHSAREARRQRHTQFLGAMRRILTLRFEHVVDQVLEDRWTYLQFKEKAAQAFEEREQSMVRRTDRLLHALDEHVRRCAARDEAAAFAPDEALHVDAARSLNAAARHVEHEFIIQAREMLGELEYDGRPVARLNEGALPAYRLADNGAIENAGLPILSIELPFLPILAPDPVGEENLTAEQTPVFVENASVEILSETPVMVAEAVLTATTGTQTSQAIDCAAQDLHAWIHEVRCRLEEHLLHRARAHFETIHGFAPEDAPRNIVRMETQYMQVKGTPVTLPTAHLSRPNLSPALFLFRIQQPGFITYWNSALLSAFCDEALPRIQQHTRKTLEKMRYTLLDEWDYCREQLSENIHTLWLQQGRSACLKGEANWPVGWATALMRGSLREPWRMPALRQNFAQKAQSVSPSLFIDDRNDSFLQPGRPGHALPQEELVSSRLRTALTEETESLWKGEHTLRVGIPLRKRVRLYTGLGIAMVLSTALIWIGLFGLSTLGLAMLAVIAGSQASIVWLLIEYFIQRAVEANMQIQTDQVFFHVRSVLNERIDHLQRFAARFLEEQNFHTEIGSCLPERQTQNTARYLGYGELIERLQAMKK